MGWEGVLRGRDALFFSRHNEPLIVEMNTSELELTIDDRENDFVLHYCTSHGGQVITFADARVICRCGRTCHSTAQLGAHKGGRAPLSAVPPRLVFDRMVEPKIAA